MIFLVFSIQSKQHSTFISRLYSSNSGQKEKFLLVVQEFFKRNLNYRKYPDLRLYANLCDIILINYSKGMSSSFLVHRKIFKCESSMLCCSLPHMSLCQCFGEIHAKGYISIINLISVKKFFLKNAVTDMLSQILALLSIGLRGKWARKGPTEDLSSAPFINYFVKYLQSSWQPITVTTNPMNKFSSSIACCSKSLV